MRETSDMEIPSTPSAFTRSSTFRVETRCRYGSCTTASKACSGRPRGCSSDGKDVPVHTVELASATVPLCVSQVRVSYPFR